MLGRIEESFALRIASESRLRRFVADASHELRTPLTAIRGFAELHRQGAVTGEEKTKELVGRIEKESIRMSSLVEDLLLLARMDQAPQFNQQAVDLNKVVGDCVASARAAGPDHPITIQINDADENYVLGDEHQSRFQFKTWKVKIQFLYMMMVLEFQNRFKKEYLNVSTELTHPEFVQVEKDPV